ncbi:MAG: hypothetical protein QM704_14035 [Anaeromyxobacteraceae bacterium]
MLAARLAVLAAALSACATPTEAAAADRQGPWSVRLVDEAGRTLPTFQQGGRTYVLGTLGRRYAVEVRNGSPRRVEVVVSVDGRDVVDGRPATPERRGYLVEPWGELTVDGFRVSDAEVAAFRFSSVPRSYASRMGDARDVGVIGVAVFPEAAPRPPPPPVYQPWGAEDDGRVGAGAASKAAPEPSAPRSADAGPAEARRRDAERPGLGTEFGERRDSEVTHVAFERASSRPAALLTLRYDDRAGLAALGIDVDGRRPDDAWLRATARPFRGYSEPPPGWR